MFALGGLSVLKQGVHHFVLVDDSGGNDSCFLVAVAASEEFASGLDCAGNNGSLLSCCCGK